MLKLETTEEVIDKQSKREQVFVLNFLLLGDKIGYVIKLFSAEVIRKQESQLSQWSDKQN